MRAPERAAAFCCAALLLLVGSGPVPIAAQERMAGADTRASAKEAERARREGALRDLERRVTESGEAGRKLASELERLRADAAGVSAALLGAATRIRAAEDNVDSVEARLETIAGSEAAIRASLEARRGVIAEVLAALQKLGRSAAPAVLLMPEDILSAIRSAMLLGAVMPGLRTEVEALSGDLAELVRLRELAAADRDTLSRELDILRAENERLQGLVALRNEQVTKVEASLREQRSRSASLGSEAKTLKELVDRLDGELSAAAREAESERRRIEVESRQIRERFAAAASRDPVKLAPRLPFSEARGTLVRPVTGAVVKEFGAPDGQGGAMRGIVIAARPKGLVTAPADGWVSYAGPFRSFGRLLIINAGDGYYVLLSGMEQASVEMGQFVLAGEPVGHMGDASSSSAALSVVEGGGPALYVEFRKDGGPIDPRPWWARSQNERVRG